MILPNFRKPAATAGFGRRSLHIENMNAHCSPIDNAGVLNARLCLRSACPRLQNKALPRHLALQPLPTTSIKAYPADRIPSPTFSILLQKSLAAAAAATVLVLLHPTIAAAQVSACLIKVLAPLIYTCNYLTSQIPLIRHSADVLLLCRMCQHSWKKSIMKA